MGDDNTVEPSEAQPIGDFRTILLTQGQIAMVDESDYEKLAQFDWFAMWDPTTGSYRAGRNAARPGGGRTTLIMAREVLGLKRGDGKIAHHRNHDTLDNRRRNLEAVDGFESTMSRAKFKNSTSGLKGVSFKKGKLGAKKWVARIQAFGVRRHLGYFLTAEEASAAYEQAQKELHADFAWK